jgi:hypothetical protein
VSALATDFSQPIPPGGSCGCDQSVLHGYSFPSDIDLSTLSELDREYWTQIICQGCGACIKPMCTVDGTMGDRRMWITGRRRRL